MMIPVSMSTKIVVIKKNISDFIIVSILKLYHKLRPGIHACFLLYCFIISRYSSVAEHYFRKVGTWVRFPLSAPKCYNLLMKIMEKEQYRRLAIFFMISGVGALWLTFWWYKLAF